MGILSLVDWNLCGPFQAHVILVHSPILVICDSVSEKKKFQKIHRMFISLRLAFSPCFYHASAFQR